MQACTPQPTECAPAVDRQPTALTTNLDASPATSPSKDPDAVEGDRSAKVVCGTTLVAAQIILGTEQEKGARLAPLPWISCSRGREHRLPACVLDLQPALLNRVNNLQHDENHFLDQMRQVKEQQRYSSVTSEKCERLSYGPDLVDIYRRAAPYVDRILRGEKPGDLPVQFPTKFEMVVNRKTANALGLAIPPSILLRATEVIE
jgi:hypothetical protein